MKYLTSNTILVLIIIIIGFNIFLFTYGLIHKSTYQPIPDQITYLNKILPLNNDSLFYFWETKENINPSQAYAKFINKEAILYKDSIIDYNKYNNFDTLWFFYRLDQINDLNLGNKNDLICVKPNRFKYSAFAGLTFYMIKNNPVLIGNTGKFVNRRNKPEKLYWNDWCVPLSDDINSAKGILVKVYSKKNYSKTIFNYKSSFKIEVEQRLLRREEERSKQIFGFIFVAILLNFLIYTIFQYFQIKQSSYFWYALYLFGLILYHLEHIELDHQVDGIFSYIMQWHYALEVPVVVIIYLAYIQFVDTFLELKDNTPKVHNILVKVSYVILTLPIIDIFIRSFWGPGISMLAYNIYRIPLFMIAGYFFFVAFKLKSQKDVNPKYINLYSYVILGSLALIVGGILNLSLKFINDTNILEKMGLWGHKLNYTRFGILIENILFMLGLSYKARLDVEERATYETRIAYFEKEMVNLETQAMRARIPSHTASNITSDIKSLIQQKEFNKAEKYSVLFNNFLRQHYEQSLKKYITLKEELDSLEDYIKLKLINPTSNINFRKEYDEEEIDLGYHQIPPGLLLPIVENAIDHAFIHQNNQKEKNVTLKITEENDSIIIEVKDNGKGIKNKNAKNKDRESTGLDSIKTICDREGIALDIKDNIPHGTTIIFHIKSEEDA